MTDSKKHGKGVAVLGVVIALVAAGLKRREMVEVLQGTHHHTMANPARLSWADWKSILLATMNALGSKNLPSFAASVAYFSTLAIFPMLAAAVAISALLITTEQLNALISAIEGYLPPDLSSVIISQIQGLVSRRTDNVLAASIAIAVALFGASGASKNLVIASNVAYGVKESRGWLAQQIWGIIWTVIGIAFGFLVVALLALNAPLLSQLNLPEVIINTLLYGRWAVLLLLTILGLSVFYRYGPDRPNVRWHWVSWGATIATLVWMVATLLFFVYVQNFANYSQSYSLFAGIIVLMVWVNLSALILLLGAEINAQIEAVSHKK